MSKYKFEIVGGAVLLVTAILWIVGSAVESFAFDWKMFLLVNFLANALLQIWHGFLAKGRVRFVLAGALLLAGLLMLFSALNILTNAWIVVALVIFCIALTSFLILLCHKGDKWDKADNQ